MKLGFVSAILPDLGFEEVVSFASSEGYEVVEMMCWPKGKAERRYAGVTHIDVDETGPREIERIKKNLAEKRVAISALGYYPNPLTKDEKAAQVYVEHLKRVIHLSAELGVNQINTFIGRETDRDLDYNLEKFARVWKPIVAYAEQEKVRIGIENCPMFFSKDEWPNGNNIAYSPSIWRRMFELIPSASLGLNYDPSHLLWQQIDYIAPIYEFKERIFHVHIKDAKVLKDRLGEVGILSTPLEFHSPKLPGLGDVEWGRFFSALTDVRYSGPACVEVEDRSFEDSLASRKLSLRQSRNYLRQFFPI